VDWLLKFSQKHEWKIEESPFFICAFGSSDNSCTHKFTPDRFPESDPEMCKVEAESGGQGTEVPEWVHWAK